MLYAYRATDTSEQADSLALVHPRRLASTAEASFKRGAVKKAAIEWDAAIHMGFSDSRLYLNLGAAHYRAGNIPKALESWRSGLNLAPGSPDLLSNLVSILAENDQVQEAIHYQERIVGLRPEDPTARNTLDLLMSRL